MNKINYMPPGTLPAPGPNTDGRWGGEGGGEGDEGGEGAHTHTCVVERLSA